VYIDCSEKLSVQPNVSSSGEVNIQLLSYSKEAGILNVVDALGRVIEQRPIEILEGNNTYIFNVDKLAAGIYFINIDVKSWKGLTTKYIKEE